MPVKKYEIRVVGWAPSNARVQGSFFSRRAAEHAMAKLPRDTSYEIVEVQVPLYVPKAGSPGIGDPELTKHAKPKEPDVVVEEVVQDPYKDPDDDGFTFLKSPMPGLDEIYGNAYLEYFEMLRSKK